MSSKSGVMYLYQYEDGHVAPGYGINPAQEEAWALKKFQNLASNPKKPGRFHDVIGMASIKEKLEFNEFLVNNKELVVRQGCTGALDSMILIGLPGTGKKFVVEAFANEFKEATYIPVEGYYLFHRNHELAFLRMRALYKVAKERAPCIVLIDKICDDSRKNWDDWIFCAFREQLDMVRNEGLPIMTIVTTEFPWKLPESVLWRLQRNIFYAGLPTVQQRADLLRRELGEEAPKFSAEELESFGRHTINYSFADVFNLGQDLKKSSCQNVAKATHFQKQKDGYFPCRVSSPGAIRMKGLDVHVSQVIFPAPPFEDVMAAARKRRPTSTDDEDIDRMLDYAHGHAWNLKTKQDFGLQSPAEKTCKDKCSVM